MSPAAERRRAVRWRSRDELPLVRVRGGHEARALDVAAGGMLLETDARLRPGSAVELQVTAGDRTTRLRGRVVRCSVGHLQPSRVRYLGAVQFDAEVAWFSREGHGYPVLTSGAADRAGAGEKLPVI